MSTSPSVLQLDEKNRLGQDQGDKVGKIYRERTDAKSIDEPQDDAGVKNKEHQEGDIFRGLSSQVLSIER